MHDSVASWLLPALIGLVGVCLTVVFGYVQWRKSQSATASLDSSQREWDRERLQLEHELALERDQATHQADEDDRLAAEEQQLSAARMQAAETAQTLVEQTSTYRSRLVQALRNVRILDMARPLDLQDLYVQVRVREEARRRYSTNEVQTQGSDQSSDDDPEALLARFDETTPWRDQGALSPEEALAKHHRVAFLGDPGAGKTTLLRYLALSYANSNTRVPVYVELRRFVDADQDSLLEFACADCATRYGFSMSAQALESAFHSGEAIMLLDGLDETLGGDSFESAQNAYHSVAAEIDRFVARYPRVGVAVTCRRAGWQGELESFTVLEVLDFAWPEVQRFVRRWFGHDRVKAEGLKATLSRNVRMRSLAANPLLLSLICIVYERELELPERRAELYNRCIEVLLREWDAHRGIKRFSRFTTDRKRDLLEELAWCFHLAGKRYQSEDDLLALVRDYLPSIDIDPAEDRSILQEITSQYGLLKEQARGVFGFLHLTLQEYFAAVAANNRGGPEMEHVFAHARHPWWEEVTLLLAGRMSDSSSLLTHLLQDGSDLTKECDLRSDRLLFAARCLIGTPRVRTVGLRESILADTRKLCDQTPFALIATRAARVLGEIGDRDSVDHILRLVSQRDDRIGSALLAGLRGVCDAASAERLMAMTEADLQPSSIAHQEALTVLTSARPPGIVNLLRTLLRGQDKVAAGHAVNAAGELAELDLAEDVVLLLASDNDVVAMSWLRERCAQALVRMGAVHAAPLLLAQRGGTFGDKIYIESAIRLDGPTIGPQVRSEVRDPAVSVFRRLAGVEAMLASREDSDVDFPIEVAENDELPWQLRWLAIASLERSRAWSETVIQRLYADSKEHEVTVGAAATLAMWGVEDVGKTLRDAILNDSIPCDLKVSVGGRSVSHGFAISTRLGEAASVIGDTIVLRALTERLRHALSAGDRESTVVLSSYLAPFDADEPSSLMLEFLEKADLRMIHSSRRRWQNDMWSAAARLATVRDTPRYVKTICESHETANTDDAYRWAGALVSITSSPCAPEELLEPLRGVVDALEDGTIRDKCFEALDSVCRRLRPEDS